MQGRFRFSVRECKEPALPVPCILELKIENGPASASALQIREKKAIGNPTISGQKTDDSNLHWHCELGKNV